MKAPVNPFLLTGYVGKKWFCDREKELSVLEDHVRNGRNVVLYSWRRMGKTALIKCLFDELHRKEGTDGLFVDLLATQNLDDALRAITRAVYEMYGRTHVGFNAALRSLFSALGVSLSFDAATGFPEVTLALRETSFSARSLQAIGDFLMKQKKSPVIALDEFQQVTTYEDQNVEAVFRDWTQSFPSIRFLFSGSHRKMMQAMFNESNRPFYQSAQMMALDPIQEKEYAKFIRKHFASGGKSIPDTLIHEMYGWSRGQTYCIQLVCNHLYALNRELGEDVFEEVLSQLLEQQAPVFANYRNLMTSGQWNVLVALAKDEPVANPLGHEFVSKYKLGATSSVSTALKALQRMEMVIEEGEYHLVHDVLLSRWLKRI